MKKNFQSEIEKSDIEDIERPKKQKKITDIGSIKKNP